MPTTAYRATFDEYAGTPIRSCGFGRNGCRGGIAGVGSFGTNSPRSESVTPCRQPGSSTATHSRAKLFHEEPEAGKLHIRDCEPDIAALANDRFARRSVRNDRLGKRDCEP